MNAMDYDRIDVLLRRARAERARAVGRGLRAFATAPASAARNVRRWMQRRAAYRVLQALDDRTLKDVGVYRNDLWRIAGGAERDEPAPVPAAASSTSAERPAAAGPANDNPLRPDRATGTLGRLG